jgi:pimeloyl-ACP methyl ester carboxylesterase
MLQSKQFECDHLELSYVQGPQNGPPLVLLHGLSDRWQGYYPLIPFLYPYYTLYALDLRGHGSSGRGEGYKIVDYAHDIQIFLRQNFAEPVSLVGHSLGAAVSLFTAAQNPSLIKSITLIDPFIFKDKLEDKEFCKYFKDCFKAITENADTEGILNSIKETGALAKKRAIDLFRLDKKTIMAVLDKIVFDGFNLEELLSRTICPVLVIRGNPVLEGHLTAEKADYLKDRLGKCVLEYLDKSSHVVHIDQTMETAQRILNFLTSVYDAC